MNLRPPGYEPGELPGCSTPRRGSDCSTGVTIRPVWDWAIWAALIAAALVVVAALALLALRALRGWRDLKGLRAAISGALAELSAGGERTTEKLAAAGETEELQRSLARLRVSLARLAVLREAVDEVQDGAGRVTAVMPRK